MSGQLTDWCRSARGISLVWLLTVLAAVAPIAGARAGECTESDEGYVAALERIASAGPPFQESEAFYCLSCVTEDYFRWAGPNAAARFRSCRESPLRERIARACVPFLDAAPGADSLGQAPRAAAAALLACYGFGQVGGHDIFATLSTEGTARDRLEPERLMALAALRDARTAAFLRKSYDALPARMAKDERRRTISSIINCLYHLPGDDAIQLAIRIRQGEKDPELRARAERVIHR